MLERIWNKGNIPPLLVAGQTCPAILENNIAVSQQIRNLPTPRCNSASLGHVPKGYSVIP